MKITEQCKLPLSLEKTYRAEVLCDIVEMDACHVLLGRPWQFDVDATHKGRDNTYTFSWKQKRIVVVPNKTERSSPKKEEKALLAIPVEEDEFVGAMKETKEVMALVVKDQAQKEQVVPIEVRGLLEEFKDVMAEPTRLPPLRDV